MTPEEIKKMTPEEIKKLRMEIEDEMMCVYKNYVRTYESLIDKLFELRNNCQHPQESIKSEPAYDGIYVYCDICGADL